MEKVIEWRDVLERKDIIGGYLMIMDNRDMYIGPIGTVVIEGTIRILIPLLWCAKKVSSTEWTSWTMPKISIKQASVTPKDIGDGCVNFQLPGIGSCTIYPEGNKLIDPARVNGLPKNWKRLLVRYPNLTLDRTIAEQVCRDNSFLMVLENLPTLPPKATLSDFLLSFRHDSSREEFLWHYIEAVTGEKNVAQKVY